MVGYRDLVARLPEGMPVYGLHSPFFDRRSPMFPSPSLEQLARTFVGEVRRFQPEGPYLLGGYCFGGTLAHEMAHQLEDAGESVAFLALIESSPYGHGSPHKRRPTRLERDRANFKMKGYSGALGAATFAYDRVFGRFSWIRRKPRRLAYRLARRTGWAWPGRLWSIEQVAIQTAMGRYKAPTSGLHIALFDAHDPAYELETNIWESLVSGGADVDPITAPGIGHLSIMRPPHVDLLVARLNERLLTAVAELETPRAKATVG